MNWYNPYDGYKSLYGSISTTYYRPTPLWRRLLNGFRNFMLQEEEW